MTRRVALIGWPLRRTHSAVMHNAAFASLGIDARYELNPIEIGGLDGFFDAARGEEWLGFQVTSPYKQEAARRCDLVETAAERIGAVNSVVREKDGSLTGFNTDSPGFARAVEVDLDLDLPGLAVAVAGAGGAARAVVHACLEGGASRVIVGSRRLESSKALIDGFGDSRLSAVTLGIPFDAVVSDVDLAVNATTVGMTSPGLAFDPARLASGGAVFDLVYVPAETPLLATARQAGVPAANGASMLVAQAEIAFERWTGHGDTGAVMAAALAPLLESSSPP